MSLYFHDTRCSKGKDGLHRIGKKGCSTCKLIEKVADEERSTVSFESIIFHLSQLDKKSLKSLRREIKRELGYARRSR